MRVFLERPPEEPIDLSRFAIAESGFSVEIARDDETNGVVRTLTGEITFVGESYHRLYDTFFSDPAAGCGANANLIVEPDCCDKTYRFLITSDAIVADTLSCEMRVTLQAESVNQRAYDCLRNQTYWWGVNATTEEPDRSPTGFINGIPHPKIRYCRTPVDTMHLVNVMLLFIYGLLAINTIGLDILNSAAAAVAAGALTLAIATILMALLNCRRWHIAPYLKDILEYNCQRCGISLSSEILEDQIYSRTAILQAQRYRGDKGRNANSISNFEERNAPNLNTIELLDLVAPAFNAEWRIEDNTLFFDPRTNLPQSGPVVLDLTDPPQGLTSNLEYRYDLTDYAATGLFEYTQDPIDDESNQVQYLFEYVRDLKEDGDCRKGIKRVTLPFSVPHTGRDAHDDYSDVDDILADIARWLRSNWIKRERNSRRVSQILDDEMPDGRKPVEDDLLLRLTKHSSANLKLLALDDDVDSRGGSLIRVRVSEQDSTVFDVNWPFYWSELYERFYRETEEERPPPVVLDRVSWTPENFCQTLTLLEQNSLSIRVVTPFGTVSPERISIDFDNAEITFDGLVVI